MAANKTKPKPVIPMPDDHYFVRSQQPLHALMLLLPLVAIYEFGAFYFANDAIGQQLVARQWIQLFFEQFGAVGEYLPGLVVVVVLLAMHFTQKNKKWKFEPVLYPCMAGESLALAIPLVMFALLTGSRTATILAAGEATGGDVRAWMILVIGAGIYEELIFRMVCIALIHFVACDLMGFAKKKGAFIAILLSTLLFALSHFNADHPFEWGKFAFFYIAGFYFAMIYLLRGFGIVVATHAIYDVVAVAMQHDLIG